MCMYEHFLLHSRTQLKHSEKKLVLKPKTYYDNDDDDDERSIRRWQPTKDRMEQQQKEKMESSLSLSPFSILSPFFLG